jgi:FkbM family methyltransferase
MLTTKAKVSLAALAYRVVAFGRNMVGKDKVVAVRRGGLRWRLDLSEGFDFAIYLGLFERSTVLALQRLVSPGDVVFDIGANIGGHTLGLARSIGPSGRVFAFEPTDFAFAKLKCNLALNPELEARTFPQQILLAAEPGGTAPQEIYASWPLEKEDDSVHPKHRGRLVTARGASVDTLDGFVERQRIDRLNLIKIDVDGSELPVLQGGLEVLKRFRPILVIEMSPYIHAENLHSFGALVDLLRSAGYFLQDETASKSIPLDTAKLEALIPDGASINVIARPNVAPVVGPQ